MYFPKTWAMAFVNSIERKGGNIEEDTEALSILVRQVMALPGTVFGRANAGKLEKLLAEVSISPDHEVVVSFLILMVKKNMLRYFNLILKEINKIVNKKKGLIEAAVEYSSSFELQSQEESKFIEAIKKRSGAKMVVLNKKYNPALIGGYKLRIGDEVIDASLSSQLVKLQATLTSSTAFISGPASLQEDINGEL